MPDTDMNGDITREGYEAAIKRRDGKIERMEEALIDIRQAAIHGNGRIARDRDEDTLRACGLSAEAALAATSFTETRDALPKV